MFKSVEYNLCLILNGNFKKKKYLTLIYMVKDNFRNSPLIRKNISI